VDQFNRYACFDRAVAIAGTELSGYLSEERPISFPPGTKKVLCDIGEESIIRFRHLEQAPLNGSHALPHSGNGHEVVQDWAIHGSPGLWESGW
jgi:hypothetical protein